MLKLIIPMLTLLLLPMLSMSPSIWATSTISLMLLALYALTLTPTCFNMVLYPFIFLDQLSTTLITLTLWISALMFLASQKTFLANNNIAKFTFMINSLALILLSAFSVTNIILFYILFEASLIPTLLLILGWGYQPERLQAGSYLMLYTITASLPLLFALMIMNNISSHTSILIPFWNLLPQSSLHQVWWLITISAFLVKTPMFLTHLWLPKAHVEAPVAGSMILAGLLLKLGGYGLLRLSSFMLFLNSKVAHLIMSISLVGAVITSFICLRQTDVKSLIAYSSVSHMGLVTGGIMSNTSWGWHGALAMMLAHGLCSSCMFSLANMTYETTQTRSMFITKGMMMLFPSMTFWWFMFSAANMAAPPSINLLGEIILLTSILSYSFISVIMISFVSFLAAAYSLFLYTSTQHGQTPHYLNPLSLFSQRHYSISLMHGLPILALIAKSDFITLWT